jgi:hypothetical protein
MKRFNIDNLVKSRHSGLSGIGCFCNALKKKDSGQAGMTVSRYYRTIYGYINIIIIVLSFCFFVPAAYAAEKDYFQFKKQTELQQIKPKKPVKIKLRRSAKDEYTWELSGDDADEIVKTNKRLRKMLNPQ